MSELAVVVNESTALTPGRSLLDLGPAAMVAGASEMAGVLRAVIEKQGLFENIQGKKHVKLEGWTTLGSMLGVLPREKRVRRFKDGSYEAHVELVNYRSGIVIGSASAICGIDEKRWARADRYARRSMAVTRATGKAYRLSFGWIMTLGGYAVTPEEEMPHHDDPKPDTPKPVARIQRDVTPPTQHSSPSLPGGQAPKVELFDKDNFEHTQKLSTILENRGTAPELHLKISELMHGKKMVIANVDESIKEAQFDHDMASTFAS